MRKSIKRTIFYSSGLATVIILLLIFVPKTYQVLPFKERSGTQYWELDNGSRIGYTLINTTKKKIRTPIIYLHGGPGGMIQDKTINLLKPLSQEGYDIYLYDQIGSGHSKRLDDISEYSVNRHTEDLEKIIEQIGAEKVILFGHSWGAMLAINYLGKNSAKVEKLIVSGPGPILPIKSSIAQLVPPDSLNLVNPRHTNNEGNEKANNIRSTFIRYYVSIFEKKPASDQEVDNFFTYLNSFLIRSTTCDGSAIHTVPGGAGYYAHLMTIKSFNKVNDIRNKLKDNQTPLLIIKGQCDNQKWGFTQEYLSLFSNSRLEIIDNAGHSIEEVKHPNYLKIINEFLTDHL